MQWHVLRLCKGCCMLSCAQVGGPSTREEVGRKVGKKKWKRRRGGRRRGQKKRVLDLEGVDSRWESVVRKGPRRTRQVHRRGSGVNVEVVSRTVARD